MTNDNTEPHRRWERREWFPVDIFGQYRLQRDWIGLLHLNAYAVPDC